MTATEIVEIEMLNNKGEWVTETFELKPYGTPWQYERDMHEASVKTSNSLAADLFLCEKYLPYVIGKDRFMQDGLDSKLKFKEVLEEFFINDSTALQMLSQKVGFFLSPATKIRFEKRGLQQN